MAATIRCLGNPILRLNNLNLDLLYQYIVHFSQLYNLSDNNDMQNLIEQFWLASNGLNFELSNYLNSQIIEKFTQILRESIRLLCGSFSEDEIGEGTKSDFINFYGNIKKYELYLKHKELDSVDYWNIQINNARIFCNGRQIFTTDFVRFDFFYESLISVAKVDNVPLNTALQTILDQFKNCGNGIDFDIANYLKTYEDTIILLYLIAQSTLEFCLIYPPLTQEGIKLHLMRMLVRIKEYGFNLPQTETIPLDRVREYEQLIPFKHEKIEDTYNTFKKVD